MSDGFYHRSVSAAEGDMKMPLGIVTKRHQLPCSRHARSAEEPVPPVDQTGQQLQETGLIGKRNHVGLSDNVFVTQQ